MHSGVPSSIQTRLCLKTMVSACERLLMAGAVRGSPPVAPLQAVHPDRHGLARCSLSASNPFLRQSLGSTSFPSTSFGSPPFRSFQIGPAGRPPCLSVRPTLGNDGSGKVRLW